ncbi:MAG: hypothetical protein Q8Q14_14750 [Gemmatimonadales bacterium]|nr:hypothetical protein [Gemmatimonadales bacterium]
MGTVVQSIGTDGRTFSTITAWEAQLDDAGVFSAGDDAVGECYDDSPFDETVTINGGGTIGLASITLTVAEGERHDGTAGTGARIVRGSQTDILLDINEVAPTSIRWLDINMNEQFTGPGSNKIVIRLNRAGGTPFPEHAVDKCLVHNTQDPGVVGGGHVIGVESSSNFRRVTNNLFWRFIANSGSVGTACVLQDRTGLAQKDANNTIHGLDTPNHSGGGSAGIRKSNATGAICQNNVVTGVLASGGGSAACFSGTLTGGTESHNASSDATATGTGSLTGIDPADQFVSTVVGSEDLHLKAGADCIDAGTDLGTTPTGVNIDIDGRDRDAEGDTWDIGADEFVLPFVPPSGNMRGGLHAMSGGMQ